LKNDTITAVFSSAHSASVNPMALCFSMNLLRSSSVRQPSSSSENSLKGSRNLLKSVVALASLALVSGRLL